jgi:hypothetical protein
MKKYIALFVAFAFMVTLAGLAFGRTLEEEKQAVRDYLKVIDAKIIKARKAGQTAKVKVLQGEKQGTLRRWEKLKAEMEAQPVAPAVAPAPTPAPVVAKPAAVGGGLFGWGINTCLSGTYIATGKGSIGGAGQIRGDIVLDDFVGLGPLVGLSANTIKYKVGLGVVDGGGAGLKAIPIYADGVINLPADMMGGLETYLTGGLNYVVYGNTKNPGRLAGEIGVGLNADLGLGLGKTGFELGWEAVCSKTVTAKGLTFTVSQPIGL